MAKLIIKLINDIATTVNNDPDVNDRIRVAFVPNFSVKSGQLGLPPEPISPEQISTAAKRLPAPGT